MKKYVKIYKYMMSSILIAFIAFIILLNFFAKDKIFSDSENRMLQQKPYFSLDNLFKGNFTTDYENYIADQFALRDFFIGVKSTTELSMGKKENNGVYIGKNGYLFQAPAVPNKSEFDKRINAINSFAASLKNVNTYLLVAPTSSQILSNDLPAYAPIIKDNFNVNNIKPFLSKAVKFIDVTCSLASKKDEYIYYRTDHHWTTTGAYYAYKSFTSSVGITAHDKSYFNVKQVTSDFNGSLYSKGGFRNLRPDSIRLYLPKVDEGWKLKNFDENTITNSLYQMSNLQKKDKYTVFLGGNYSLLKISTNNSNGKKIVVIKDSYANSFIPFITGHYSEVYVVDLRYYNDSLQNLIKSNNIQDVLILYNEKSFFEDNTILNISK